MYTRMDSMISLVWAWLVVSMHGVGCVPFYAILSYFAHVQVIAIWWLLSKQRGGLKMIAWKQVSALCFTTLRWSAFNQFSVCCKFVCVYMIYTL